jgi:hypothetical protein
MKDMEVVNSVLEQRVVSLSLKLGNLFNSLEEAGGQRLVDKIMREAGV